MKTLQARDLPRSMVVSVHDVTPATLPRTEVILQALEALKIRRTSLLVIPNYHEHLPVREYAHFGERLRALAAAGHDIVLHGYYHKRKRRKGESFFKRLLTRVYTADEAEFYDIGGERAMDKMLRGLSDLRAIGVNPRGFIAPAWLMSDAAAGAARNVGLQFSSKLTCTIDLQRGTQFKSQSLVYSIRSGWRISASLRWNARLVRKLAANPLLRLGIHPVDFDHPAVKRQILDIAGREVRRRTPATYDQWNEIVRATNRVVDAI